MKTITFSRNVFLPLTYVCGNACGYCIFKEPVKDGCVMDPAEVRATLDRGAAFSCTEALFTFGERPELEAGFTPHLQKFGYDSILDYCYDMSRYALSKGILPHSNVGIINEEEMARMRTVTASMGLMLETTADVPAHRHSPGKDPAVRIEMIETAGKLKIPFTTGLLLGIGETREDHIESLQVIADIQKRYGHIQEIIIQNFCPKPGTEMENTPGASIDVVIDTLELAAEILPDSISIQVPPNLVDAGRLLELGVDDLGGVSPVTIDYVNPEKPWPALDELKTIARGYDVRERLCVYEKYCTPEWIDASIFPLVNELKKKVYGE